MSKESTSHGEQIFLQRCTGCHGRKADGKGPNSLDIMPHPRNLRNSWFVSRLSDRRMMESIFYGVQGTAMPPWIDYGLSQHDVGDIMNFIRSLNRNVGQDGILRAGCEPAPKGGLSIRRGLATCPTSAITQPGSQQYARR
jgi:mono/diheme cytochrome c family protein